MRKTNKNKKFSIFNILIALIITAVLTAMYISNVINVNQLSSKNNELNQALSETKINNDALRTEIEKLCTFERINNLASEKLKMKYSESSIDNKDVITIKKSELQ